MPARTAPCPSCGAPVPTEQLACPSCGTVVAPAHDRAADAADAADATGDGPTAEGHATSSFVLPWASSPDAGADEAGPLPSASEVDLTPEAHDVEPSALEVAEVEPAPGPGSDHEPGIGEDDAIAMPPMHAPVLTSPSVGGASRAGAYLPPSPVRVVPAAGAGQRPAPATYAYGQPADPAPSPATWPPQTGWAPPAAPPASSVVVRDVTEPAKPLRPGRAALLSDLPFDAPADLAGWLVAAGSIGGAIAFLLPWSPQILGSPNFGTEYWGQWGLGAPSHLAPFLLILALATLTILPNALPAWLKTGVLPLVMGAFLIGLLWPYLVGGFGSRIGATVEAFAAFLLIGGGVVAIAPRRGRSDDDEPAS